MLQWHTNQVNGRAIGCILASSRAKIPMVREFGKHMSSSACVIDSLADHGGAFVEDSLYPLQGFH